MKRRFRIKETDLDKLVNIIRNETITEQTNAAPGKEATVKFVTKDLPAEALFATGKSDPNVNSDSFTSTAEAILNTVMDNTVKKPITIKVQGGASAVGSPGFDNKKLANDRRDKTIIALTQFISNRLTNELGTTAGAGFKETDYFNFDKLDGIVGKATVKDSPEAKKEQFVRVIYPVRSYGATNATTAIDKTATKIPGMEGGLKPGTEILVRTKDTNKNVRLSQSVIDSVNNALKSTGLYLGKDSVIKPKGVS